jgi:RNA polymerase sigma factor (sigma-70 family)
MTGDEALKHWFCGEILPLEAALTRYLRRNWRNGADIADLRQEIYVRVFDGAKAKLPLQAKPYLFAVARNHLINQARRAQIVSFELVADLDASPVAPIDGLTPERQLTARDELRRLQSGLDKLPARCRDVVMLRKIEGLSQKETAARLVMSENTVERHMVLGMRALVDFMLGGTGKIKWGAGARKSEVKES